ncbi:MAG: OmpA family protein [Chitinophagaceae bacterium]|jgi:outer membrane protein OmpA-like peptidoglycan-associated protein
MTQHKTTLLCFLLGFLLCTFATKPLFAQADSLLKKVSCDCDSAVKIDIFRKYTYGFTKAPEGFGRIQEIKARANTVKTAFEEEHHSAWYLLDIKANDGELVFEITPKDKTNDYDFLLYPYKDSATCASILAEKLKPIRGNLSRNDTNNLGITGLSGNVKNEFNGKGIGAQFSKSINVKKGNKFILVLDNVYDGGKGHKISFSFVKEVLISGQVQDEEGNPLVAEVTVYDNKGLEIEKTNSNSKGNYEMKPKLSENVDYSLTFTADSSFVASEIINTNKLKDSATFANIKTVLPKLKKGGKYKVGNLNFFGDEARLIPRSKSSLESLYHLMKKNKDLKIQIEGHVNGVGSFSKPIYKQKLSDDRAELVYNYLVDRGINKERLSKIGYADLYMLFPNAQNNYEMEANRRVEIKVISLD